MISSNYSTFDIGFLVSVLHQCYILITYFGMIMDMTIPIFHQHDLRSR